MKLLFAKCRAPLNEDEEIVCLYRNIKVKRDAAKTGLINSYLNYPLVCKKITKAIGGKKSKMPFFFQYSKNGRRELQRDRKYAKINNSTMNRICASFFDIGHINMNYANVAPFNWQMMLRNNTDKYYEDAVKLFCDIDTSNSYNIITASNNSNNALQLISSAYDFIKEAVVYLLLKRYGSLELVYSSITKYLFAGDNANKQSHKTLYWKVFGDMACTILQLNILNCIICLKCGMRIPLWATSHLCPSKAKGFFECIDCGTICIRTNSKQKRCHSCQLLYNKKWRAESNRINNLKRKKLL